LNQKNINNMKKLTANQLVKKIIKELKDAGYSYEEMPKILKMAKEQYNQMIKNK